MAGESAAGIADNGLFSSFARYRQLLKRVSSVASLKSWNQRSAEVVSQHLQCGTSHTWISNDKYRCVTHTSYLPASEVCVESDIMLTFCLAVKLSH